MRAIMGQRKSPGRLTRWAVRTLIRPLSGRCRIRLGAVGLTLSITDERQCRRSPSSRPSGFRTGSITPRPCLSSPTILQRRPFVPTLIFAEHRPSGPSPFFPCFLRVPLQHGFNRCWPSPLLLWIRPFGFYDLLGQRTAVVEDSLSPTLGFVVCQASGTREPAHIPVHGCVPVLLCEKAREGVLE
jgi:hypothetical protein